MENLGSRLVEHSTTPLLHDIIARSDCPVKSCDCGGGMGNLNSQESDGSRMDGEGGCIDFHVQRFEYLDFRQCCH